ncbi:hypothetical protein BHM03_00042256 [Ensete ventricosum]|nr:hypothetical protein BHM03_00042256 [Ensete ventricosum]
MDPTAAPERDHASPPSHGKRPATGSGGAPPLSPEGSTAEPVRRTSPGRNPALPHHHLLGEEEGGHGSRPVAIRDGSAGGGQSTSGRRLADDGGRKRLSPSEEPGHGSLTPCTLFAFFAGQSGVDTSADRPGRRIPTSGRAAPP